MIVRELSLDDLEQVKIIKRYKRQKTVYRRIRAIKALKKIIEKHGIASAQKVSNEYIGLTEDQFKSLLFAAFLMMKEKPAWMSSIVDMRKRGLLRQDGSTAGKIF